MLYSEEQSILSKKKQWDEDMVNHALYTNLFVNNETIMEVMNNRHMEEYTKRNFLSCMLQESFSEKDFGFIKFHKLFHPKLIFASNKSNGNVVAVSSYREIYSKDKQDETLFVIKTTRERGDPMDVYHELFVGRFGVNELKKKVPNYMYTYSIIEHCSMYKFNHFCTTPGEYRYLVAEKVKGITLLHFVEKMDVSEDILFNIFIQIINALYIAKEECNFIHGDLHNENIIIEILDHDIHIPLYLESTNPTTYITTKHVARMIDYGLSNVRYKHKNYNGLETVYGTRSISCVLDLFKFILNLPTGKKYKRVMSVIYDAFNHTVNSPFTIQEYIKKLDKEEKVDKYLEFALLGNDTLKQNTSFSYRDYYNYIRKTHPYVIDEQIIGKRKGFMSYIYNHKKEYDLEFISPKGISDVYSGEQMTKDWDTKYYGIRNTNGKIHKKITREVYDALDTKDIEKELSDAKKYSKLVVNITKNDFTQIKEITKGYTSQQEKVDEYLTQLVEDVAKKGKNIRSQEIYTKTNQQKDYESLVNDIKTYNKNKLNYISSYVNLIYILGIIELLDKEKYDLTQYRPLMTNISKFMKEQDGLHILKGLKKVDLEHFGNLYYQMPTTILNIKSFLIAADESTRLSRFIKHMLNSRFYTKNLP